MSTGNAQVALRVEEVMRRLAISRHTVMKWLKSGKLKGFHEDRVIRIDPESVEALLGRPPQERD